MKISEIIMDKYKLRIPPRVYYELLADVQEVEEEQEPTTKKNLGVDCVARQDVERYIEGFVNEYTPKEELEFINLELDGLKHIPSVTPQEPKTGHWIETAEEYYKAVNEKGGGVNEDTDYFTDDIACSECLAKFSVIDNEAERFDFCPCCGSGNK